MIKFGSGYGLVPDGNKALTKPIFTYHQQGLVAFILGNVP